MVATLVALLAFQSAGWLMFWLVLVQEARQMASCQMFSNKKALIELKLDKASWKAARIDAREIKWQGNMYDIESMHTTADSVYLLAYHDKHEEALFKSVGHLLVAQPDVLVEHSIHWSIWGVWLGTVFLYKAILTSEIDIIFSPQRFALCDCPNAQTKPERLFPPPQVS